MEVRRYVPHILGGLALVAAVVALAVSLTSAGPQGPQGLQGVKGVAGPVGPRGVEGRVRLVEGARVAESEAHAASCGSGLGACDAQHLIGRVDAHDLPAVAEVFGEPERCLPEAAAHVEQPVTMSEAELRPLP